jgi:SAM-dependent methyltransferase
MAIPVFQRQNKFAPVIFVQKGGTAPFPWPGKPQAVIAIFQLATIITGQRHTAGITAQPRDEGRFPPTRTAQAKITFDLIATKCAAWRIDQVQSDLKRPHAHPIIFGMNASLTDRPALLRNRAHALKAPALFLHETAADEINDRLGMVNKSFNAPAVVSGFPEAWQKWFSDATCVADDDTLFLEESAHDLVIHAMCLHWANDPVGQLIQARRALKPDGLFLGIFFGGETLHELRASLAQAEADLTGGLSPRVAPMGEIRDLGALLQRAGFALPVADYLPLKASYLSPLHLMRDLRAMGETSALAARPRHAMRRAVMLRACELYAETFGTEDGRVSATFDLMVMTGWAPDESQPQPLRPGTATARLADALGTRETPLKD